MDRVPLIEAVPNFSEGRRIAVIEELARSVQWGAARLLDRSSDRDHNRTVLTVAGPPESILQGLFDSVELAAAQIDLRRHRGVHPRLGAADVVPLVPLRGISLAECAGLARRLGRRIGAELGLPVYLYAAASSDHRSLAELRRGQFERLQEEIHLPRRAPDFGPAKVGPAGAVIVGARPALIAFNVFLRTGDATVAKAIAGRIRERDGGLPAVRALGLRVDGKAQVSMNLVDYRLTPPAAVLAAIRREAARHAVSLDRSELIGLIPLEALPGITRGESRAKEDAFAFPSVALTRERLADAAEALLLPDLGCRNVLEYAVAAAFPSEV